MEYSVDENANAEKVKDQFLKDRAKYQSRMSDDVSSLLAGKPLSYRDPHLDERDDKVEMVVNSVDEVSDWSSDGSWNYDGDGVTLINFEAVAHISADDPGSTKLDSEGNPDSSRSVRVSGVVTITIDPNLMSADQSKPPEHS